MSLNFLRKYKLTIATRKGKAVIIREQQIKFRISKRGDSKLNEMDLDIINLSHETLSVFDEQDVVVQLEVGWGDSPLVTIFKGDKLAMNTRRDNTEIITNILAAEGAVTIREGRTQVAAPEGSTVKDIIEKIIKDGMPAIKTVNANGDDLLGRTYPRGYSATGNAKDALNKICNDNNLNWSIEGSDVINVTPKNGDIKRKAIVITPTMIKNTPEKTTSEVTKLKDDLAVPKPQGLNMKLQLNPLFIAGNVVQVKGTFNADGNYVIDKVEHDGDYEGGSWDTTLNCTIYGASK